MQGIGVTRGMQKGKDFLLAEALPQSEGLALESWRGREFERLEVFEVLCSKTTSMHTLALKMRTLILRVSLHVFAYVCAVYHPWSLQDSPRNQRAIAARGNAGGVLPLPLKKLQLSEAAPNHAKFATCLRPV